MCYSFKLASIPQVARLPVHWLLPVMLCLRTVFSCSLESHAASLIGADTCIALCTLQCRDWSLARRVVNRKTTLVSALSSGMGGTVVARGKIDDSKLKRTNWIAVFFFFFLNNCP